ncbi:MAG: hypothetical protein PHR82_07930 [Endomicrobiaceae bacterium]|nr:hypothetical protein [Endomicrobiaceae bacterium]
MKTIELKEYEYSEELDNDFLFSFKAYLKALSLENAFTFELNRIKTSSYVGTIRFKGIQISILPKILSESDDKKQILDNLIFMLSCTNKLKIKNSGNANISKTKNSFIEILISFFAESLLRALLSNIPHDYESQNENLRYIKGKIDFKNDIKHNSFNKSKIYCLFDDFKEDNMLNRIFKFVSSALIKLSEIEETKNKLKNILTIYDDVIFERVTVEKINKITLKRSQQIFETPLKLAELFIKNSSIHMINNRFKSIALLFDMNELFEEFVFNSLKRIYGSKVQAQFKKGMLKNLSFGNDIQPFRKYTRSDIHIKGLADCPIIIDTKYKIINSPKDISISDIYQIMAYSRVYKSKKLILLYPQAKLKFIHKVGFYEDVLFDNDLNIYIATLNLSMSLKNRLYENDLKNIVEKTEHIKF